MIVHRLFASDRLDRDLSEIVENHVFFRFFFYFLRDTSFRHEIIRGGEFMEFWEFSKGKQRKITIEFPIEVVLEYFVVISIKSHKRVIHE